MIGVVVSYFTGGQQLNFAVPVDYLSALILHPEPQPVMKGSFAELLNDSECPVNLPEVGNIADLKEPIRLLNVLNGWFEQQPTSNFHKMVNKYPNSPSAHLLLGLSLREHGLLEDAAKEVATSIELGEASADAQYILGSIIHTLYIARLDQGNATALLVQAEAALRKAVIMDETLDGAWCKLGLVCYKQDKYSEAKNAFQRYFESLKRKIEDNKEFYADLKKDFPSFNEYEDFYEAYLFYGMNARAMGEFTEAYNSLMQALQSPGADSRAYRELMDLYIDADDYAAGARVFRSAYGLYPRERDLLVRGIVCLVSIKAYVEARYYQRVLAAIDPGAARSFEDYFPQGQ